MKKKFKLGEAHKKLAELNIRPGQVWSIHGDEVLVIEVAKHYFVLQGATGPPCRLSRALMAATLTVMPDDPGGVAAILVCDV